MCYHHHCSILTASNTSLCTQNTSRLARLQGSASGTMDQWCLQQLERRQFPKSHSWNFSALWINTCESLCLHTVQLTLGLTCAIPLNRKYSLVKAQRSRKQRKQVLSQKLTSPKIANMLNHVIVIDENRVHFSGMASLNPNNPHCCTVRARASDLTLYQMCKKRSRWSGPKKSSFLTFLRKTDT